ncbi:MAG: enoyl-CoA hydratase/isomerase family protein [Chloroflexi bacterium]|nr:enoyl-CoA hydratase/isomerase family protein [Chloroflexota bacterium]
MPPNTLLYNIKDHVAYLTLDRPQESNVINEALAREMKDICERINLDKDVYVVIITGAGDKAFCAGSEPPEASYTAASVVARIDRPVIAALNGDALGQGLELALACDIRLASAEARFGLPQLTSGMIPSDGGTQRLPRIVGKAKALEMVLTGETIGAEEALRIGLVHKVVAPGNLLGEAEAMAKNMASKAPLSLRYAREAINKGMDLTLEQGLRLEADLYLLLHTTQDRTEGIRAFLEKRNPQFKGE